MAAAQPFDIALMGCGGYGLPLAGHRDNHGLYLAPAQIELVGNPYTTSQIHFMTEGATPNDPLDADKHSMIEQDRDGNLGISCGGAAALAAGGQPKISLRRAAGDAQRPQQPKKLVEFDHARSIAVGLRKQALDALEGQVLAREEGQHLGELVGVQ